jgi:hypothetical protein
VCPTGSWRIALHGGTGGRDAGRRKAAGQHLRWPASQVHAAGNGPTAGGCVVGSITAGISGRRSMGEGGAETITSGIADAIALDAAGDVSVMVDWKSDVGVTDRQRSLYRAQVRDYLTMANATVGLVVYLTTGQVGSVRA